MSSGSQLYPFWLGTPLINPKIQYGLFTDGTGPSGNAQVALSTMYANSNYSVVATHQGTTAGLNTSVEVESQSSFRLYWNNGGAGTQRWYFMTIGNQ